MAIWQIFKVNRKTFFNPSAWLDVDTLKASNRSLWYIIRDLFFTPTPLHSETFEEAKQRLNLSDEDLKTVGNNYFLYAVMFVILGCLVAIFSFYLLFIHATGHGFILGLLAAGLFFAQAFRFHFWYFQIKVKKLGCTFQEWRAGKVIDRTEA